MHIRTIDSMRLWARIIQIAEEIGSCVLQFKHGTVTIVNAPSCPNPLVLEAELKNPAVPIGWDRKSSTVRKFTIFRCARFCGSDDLMQKGMKYQRV